MSHILTALFIMASILGGHSTLLSDQCSRVLEEEDSAILDVFFRTFIKYDSAGYVLFGEKPVCSQGFLKEDFLSPITQVHKETVAFREALKVWNKLNIPHGNITLQFYDQASKDSLSNLYTHFIIINKPLFLEVVKENIVLFKYILGPKLTPEELFFALTTPYKTLATTLKGDKALIGILLGFGTENAIAFKRYEDASQSTERNIDIPPFQSKKSHLNTMHSIDKNYLLLSFPDEKDKAPVYEMTQPSFGYKTVMEELTSLPKLFVAPPVTLYNQDSPFAFGYLKDNPLMKDRISILEKTQLQIRELLEKKTFLADVLMMITDRQWSVTVTTPINYKLKMDPELIVNLDIIISKYIWNFICDYSNERLVAFVEGFSHPASETPKPFLIDYPEYKDCLNTARKNLYAADLLFTALSKNLDMHQISSDKLFYKVLSTGDGQQFDNQAEVVVKYQFFDPNNRLVAESDSEQKGVAISLETTLPFFYHALKGMKVGETREIFIHPSLAYGVYTLNDKGVSLRGVVSLIAIQEGKTLSPPALIPENLSIIHDTEFEASIEKQNNEIERIHGISAGNFFSKISILNMPHIIENLKNYHENSFPKQIITPKEHEIINRLYWNYYYGAHQ